MTHPRNFKLTAAARPIGPMPANGPSLNLRSIAAACALLLCGLSTGCMSILSPISGIPSNRVPSQFLAQPKNNLVPIDISRLSQVAPAHYYIDAGDILGIYIEGALGTAEEPPPVTFAQRDSDLPPAIGYPIVVREDGTVSLPLVPPITVKGLTLGQVENVIRRSYTIDRKVLAAGKDRIVVTLMKEREFNVIVMRQDAAAAGVNSDGKIDIRGQTTRSEEVKLKAYENDVLHALAATGGLPGTTAKNEVKILRASLLNAAKRDAFIKEFYSSPPEPCVCFPPLPADPAIIKIPLRLPPGQSPTFRPQDIILQQGDIVLIEGREREVFYTGGLMRGGEYPLPRDYDLDVLGALALAGAGIGGTSQGGQGGSSGGGGGSFGGASAVGGVPPGQLFIIRKTPCNDQIVIAVDLNRAVNNSGARPLVQAGDILILRYKFEEEALNFGLGTFFTYGIAQLFNGGHR